MRNELNELKPDDDRDENRAKTTRTGFFLSETFVILKMTSENIQATSQMRLWNVF